MTPTAGSAVLKSPSQACAQATQADSARTWSTAPVVDSIQLQAIPAATSGTTWGRKRTVLATAPIRPVTNRRMTVATARPSTHRDAAEEQDQLEGVADNPDELLVAEDRLEVLQRLPTGPG